MKEIRLTEGECLTLYHIITIFIELSDMDEEIIKDKVYYMIRNDIMAIANKICPKDLSLFN